MPYTGMVSSCDFCGAEVTVRRYRMPGPIYCNNNGVCAYRARVGWRELTCTACGSTFMGNKGKHCPECRKR